MGRILGIVTSVILIGGCDRTTGPGAGPTTRSVATQAASGNHESVDAGTLVETIHPADSLRPDDFPVLNAALTHIAGDAEFQAQRSYSGDRIIVHRATGGGSAFVRAAQVRSDSAERALPEDALKDLETRNNSSERVTLSAGDSYTQTNRAPAPIDALKPDSARVLIRDLKTLPRGRRYEFETAFHKAYPEAKAYVYVYLPGYSADARRAIVRLAFGPSAHGSMATYVLEKSASGTWAVVWRKFVYFV